MKKNQKGLSLIVTLLMIILLIFVAIGIFWYVTRNVLEEGTEQFELGSKCLSIDVRATAVTCVAGTCDVTYTRRAGGDDIGGIKFIFSDGTVSAETDLPGNLAELGTKTEQGIVTGLSTPTSVEVAVYFIDPEDVTVKRLCAQTNTFSFA